MASDAPGSGRRSMEISVEGLELFGRHGVFPEEKALGQRFLVDMTVELLDAQPADSLGAEVGDASGSGCVRPGAPGGALLAADASVGDAPAAGGMPPERERFVDYVALMRVAEEIVSGRTYNFIETVAVSLAEEIVARFPVRGATVRVAKPHAPLSFFVREVAATAVVHREDDTAGSR